MRFVDYLLQLQEKDPGDPGELLSKIMSTLLDTFVETVSVQFYGTWELSSKKTAQTRAFFDTMAPRKSCFSSNTGGQRGSIIAWCVTMIAPSKRRQNCFSRFLCRRRRISCLGVCDAFMLRTSAVHGLHRPRWPRLLGLPERGVLARELRRRWCFCFSPASNTLSRWIVFSDKLIRCSLRPVIVVVRQHRRRTVLNRCEPPPEGCTPS